MKINYEKKTIELTAKEMKEAQTYGSQMYKDLREARNDNPGFKTTTIKAKSSSTLRINYEQMEKYIHAHDDEDNSTLKVFYTLRGLDENGKAKAFTESASYGEIKLWFVETFPEFQNLRSGIDKIMKDAKRKKEAREEAERLNRAA